MALILTGPDLASQSEALSLIVPAFVANDSFPPEPEESPISAPEENCAPDPAQPNESGGIEPSSLRYRMRDSDVPKPNS